MRDIIRKTLVCTAVSATALVGLGASPATAGEITGKGKSLATVVNPDHDPTDPHSSPFLIKGNSICAYSGLNDEYILAQLNDDPSDDNVYPRVQNPTDGPFPGIAGYACNPVGARNN